MGFNSLSDRAESSEDAPLMEVRGLALDNSKHCMPDDYYWVERTYTGYRLYCSVADVPSVLVKKMNEEAIAKERLKNYYNKNDNKDNDSLISRILPDNFINSEFNPRVDRSKKVPCMTMIADFDKSFCLVGSNAIRFERTRLVQPKFLVTNNVRKFYDGQKNRIRDQEVIDQLNLWKIVGGAINARRIHRVPFDVPGIQISHESWDLTHPLKTVGEFKFLMRTQATKFMQTDAQGGPGVYLHVAGDFSGFPILEKGELGEVANLRSEIRERLDGTPLYDVSPFELGDSVLIPGMEWTMPLRDYTSIVNLRRLFKKMVEGTVTKHDWQFLQEHCARLNTGILRRVVRGKQAHDGKRPKQKLG